MSLIDRINRVINTIALEQSLHDNGIYLAEFQTTWAGFSNGDFDSLPAPYRQAIEAGERELNYTGEFTL